MNVPCRLVMVIGVALVSGCANRVFIEASELTADHYQTGEVIEATLIGPRVRDTSKCTLGGCPTKRERQDLRALRGRLGVERVTSSELPAYVKVPFRRGPVSVDDAKSAIESGTELQWEFHTVIQLESGRQIRIVSAVDNGLSPGDSVRIGLNGSSGSEKQASLSLL